MAEIFQTLRNNYFFNIAPITKEKILHLSLLTLLAIILEYRYISFVYPEYPQFNFTLNINISRIIIGKTILIISYLFLLFKQSKFMYFSALLTNLFFLIPNIIIFQYTNAPISIILLLLLFQFLLSSNIINIPEKNIQKLNSFTIDKKYTLNFLFILAVLLLIPFIIAYRFNIDLRVFTFGSIIYEIREKGELLANIFTKYFYSPLTNFVLPIIIVLGIIQKKYLYVLFGIIAMLYLYTIIPQKGTFMSIGIVIAFYLFKDINKKITFFLISLIILILITILFSTIYNKHLPESIFVRRLFFIPAILNNAYFQVFENNHIYLSHSILKSFIDYPLNIDPTHYVSKTFWHVSSNANNGIISDGYMNFGIIGSIAEIILATFILKFIDKLNISYRFMGIIYLTLRLFISGALLTALLTHGLILLLIIAIFFLKNTENATIQT